VAAAVAEALRFSADPGELDVTFVEAGSAAAAAVASAGLRLELPRAEVRAPTAPGMDRDRPPRLR
jgi:hypothetical protein